MKQELTAILALVNQYCGIDFSGYSPGMIERRVEIRQTVSGFSKLQDYHAFLAAHPEEAKNLLDSLTIKVSRFFRDSLTFEYLAARILPNLLVRDNQTATRLLRVWSAGCSTGEEPYSVAILLHDLLKQQEVPPEITIFATDISQPALAKAKAGCYDADSVQDVKLRLLNEYFSKEGDRYQLLPTVRQLVQFGEYNLLSKSTHSPPESIFGSFDLILCRNVLIYLDDARQLETFRKLHRSLVVNGYLVLGESESLLSEFQFEFVRENDGCRIYQKIG